MQCAHSTVCYRVMYHHKIWSAAYQCAFTCFLKHHPQCAYTQCTTHMPHMPAVYPSGNLRIASEVPQDHQMCC